MKYWQFGIIMSGISEAAHQPNWSISWLGYGTVCYFLFKEWK